MLRNFNAICVVIFTDRRREATKRNSPHHAEEERKQGI